MDQKDEKTLAPDNQGGSKTTAGTGDPPATSQLQAPSNAGFVALQRPWTDHQHTLKDSMKNDELLKTKPHDGDALGYWTIQSMKDGPYQAVGSVTSETQASQSTFSGSQSPNPPAPPAPPAPAPASPTAATSGSGR